MPDASAARDVDRHVGARISERRAMLGLTQRQVAGLLGVTCHQLHKYEIGFNRVSAGRLHRIAEALGVGPAYFFEDLGAERPPRPPRAGPPPLPGGPGGGTAPGGGGGGGRAPPPAPSSACRAGGTRRRSPSWPGRSSPSPEPHPALPSADGTVPDRLARPGGPL